MSTYSEMLKHPKWQEKRLRILERDEFTCRVCESTDKTLHVHHGYYRRGLNPWEYEDETLYTLCEDCHEREQALLDRVHQRLGHLGLNLETVLGFLDALASEYPHDEFVFESPDYGFGLGACHGLTETEVFAEARKDPSYRITAGQLTAAQFRKIGKPELAERWATYAPKPVSP